MINKYKNADKDLKQYKVSKVKTGTASNGKPYTVFNISDSKQVNGQWVYDNYGVFSWQPDLVLRDGDKVEFLDIQALEVKETEYNGQKQLKKTIFADVKAITSPENAGKVDVVDTPLTEIPSDGLPF